MSSKKGIVGNLSFWPAAGTCKATVFYARTTRSQEQKWWAYTKKALDLVRLLAEGAPLGETRLAARRLAQHLHAAAALDYCLGVAKDRSAARCK